MLSIPLSALTAEEDATYVWVVNPDDSALVKTLVEVGPYQEQVVPVLSGLQADDWIVAAGTHLVRDGQVVIPVDRQNRQVELAATAEVSQQESAPAEPADEPVDQGE